MPKQATMKPEDFLNMPLPTDAVEVMKAADEGRRVLMSLDSKKATAEKTLEDVKAVYSKVEDRCKEIIVAAAKGFDAEKSSDTSDKK